MPSFPDETARPLGRACRHASGENVHLDYFITK
jgi:hypothetical protein